MPTLFRKRLTSSRFPRIALLHIPKTAGTSLLRVARRNCPPSHVHLHYPPERLSQPPAAPLPKGVLIGHFPRGYESRFFEDCDRVVFLREPMARLASHLSYERRYFLSRPESPFSRWFAAHDDLVDFIEHSRFWYLDNPMVRFISGTGEAVPFGSLTSRHLDEAIDRLAAFDFVGFQERFEEDVGRLMHRYGWRGRVPRVNTSPSRLEIRAHQRERLAAYNALDSVLYTLAWKRASATC